MKTSEVLKQAKALINTPDKWCQGTLHFFGRSCSVGALERVLIPNGFRKALNNAAAYNYLVIAFGSPNGLLSTCNDTHTHAEVMTAFDIAIANAEADEQRGLIYE